MAVVYTIQDPNVKASVNNDLKWIHHKPQWLHKQNPTLTNYARSLGKFWLAMFIIYIVCVLP